MSIVGTTTMANDSESIPLSILGGRKTVCRRLLSEIQRIASKSDPNDLTEIIDIYDGVDLETIKEKLAKRTPLTSSEAVAIQAILSFAGTSLDKLLPIVKSQLTPAHRNAIIEMKKQQGSRALIADVPGAEFPIDTEIALLIRLQAFEDLCR